MWQLIAPNGGEDVFFYFSHYTVIDRHLLHGTDCIKLLTV